MKTFEHNGKRVEFTAVSGVVHGHHKRGDTIVEASGGGGSSFQGNGYTAPVNVSSRVVVKQDFFIKDESGRQTPVQLEGVDIPLADGQQVTMISGRTGDRESWTNVVNHSAQLYWVLDGGYGLMWEWRLMRKPYHMLPIAFVIWVVLGNYVNGWIGTLAAIGYLVYEGRKYSGLAHAIREHLHGLGKETLKSALPPAASSATA